MKIQENQLCSSCRQIPFNNNWNLGQLLELVPKNKDFQNMDDDKFNAAILLALKSSNRHCNSCWQAVWSLLPSHLRH